MPTRVVMNPQGVAEIHAAAADVAWDVSGLILTDMRVYVPVLTGALLSTLRRERIPGGARIKAGDVARGIDYHLYQEYGTEHMPAQPYIRPAVYQRRSP